MTDWASWHAPYDDPGSPLSQRLREVRRQVSAALDRAPARPLRLLSLCAGRGLDVLPVLASHPRGRDVTGRLVELDARFAEAGVEETSFLAEQPEGWSVGAGTFTGELQTLRPGVRLFTVRTRPPT